MIQKELISFCGFDCTAKTLSGIYCQQPHNEQNLYEWFDSVDFDALPSEVTCMAAAAGAANAYSDVPQQLVPRLRGIIKYIHTLNSGMMSGLCVLGAALNKAEIPALLLDETALCVLYPNAPQRQLWQMFVGVKKGDYPKALEEARKIGFTVEEFENSAVARQGVTRQMIITPLAEENSIWVGATEIKKGNAVFLCPELAEIFIGINQRAFRGLTKPNPSMMRWIMDMKILLEKMSQEDWSCAIQKAKTEHAHTHICFLLAVYSAATGVEIPQGKAFGTRKDVSRVFSLLRKLKTYTEKGNRIGRLFLLFRLRRPDSFLSSSALFVGHIFKKLGL